MPLVMTFFERRDVDHGSVETIASERVVPVRRPAPRPRGSVHDKGLSRSAIQSGEANCGLLMFMMKFLPYRVETHIIDVRRMVAHSRTPEVVQLQPPTLPTASQGESSPAKSPSPS